MKVLNLQCAHQHDFEGWFGSEDDFQSQLTRGLVECPLCGDHQVTKQLSAPRLNLSTSRGEREVSTTPPAVTSAPVAQTPAHEVTSLSPAPASRGCGAVLGAAAACVDGAQRHCPLEPVYYWPLLCRGWELASSRSKSANGGRLPLSLGLGLVSV